VISAAVISQVENLPFGEALYFSFITGLTIGYGDIVVTTPFARLIAVLLGLIGMIISGIIVAVSIRAVEKSLIEHHHHRCKSPRVRPAEARPGCRTDF